MRDGNLLFLTFDQLRADVLDGALGAGLALPAFRRLMGEGAYFGNCWTAAVPCGPSRASLMTGLYAFNHRAIRNGTPLAAHHATLGTELRRLGREPLLFGYGDIAADPSGRDPADPDLGTYELPARGFRELVELRFEAPLEWMAHLRRAGVALPDPVAEPVMDLARRQGPALDAPALYPAGASDTAWLTDRTLAALGERRHRPWTAHVAYIRPHPPFVAPAPWNRAVTPDAVPPPEPAPEAGQGGGQGGAHPFRRAWFAEPSQHTLYHGFDGDCAGMAPETVQALRALYLCLVVEADHHLGRLLDWLDATGQAARTLVVLVADHGDMLGDQGYWGKTLVSAAAHRVPLILRGPGVPAGRHDAMTSSVDVAPTILDWFGAAPPPAMDGASLLALARGGGWARDVALTEVDFAEPAAPTRFQRLLGLPEQRCNTAILREPRWSYVHFNGGLPPMLFDRAADPGERVDLAADPGLAGEVSRLRARLIDLWMERADRRLTGFSFGV